MICNGCGGKGMPDLVPDCILGADVTEACNIHDYEYHLGLDKRAADRHFLDNLLACCSCENQFKFMARAKVAFAYFEAVTLAGGAFFGKEA